MPELVALALPGGPEFVRALDQTWQEGDAALPIDLRLPERALERLLSELEPRWIVDPDGRRERPASRPVRSGDALVVATSGTTGEPRGVVLTHDALLSAAAATSTRLEVDPGSDRWLACLPLSHVGGLSVVTRALLTGTPLDVQDGFDPHAVSAAARAGATLVALVPTALRRIEPSLFRTILLGGAAPPARLAPNVVTTYGMTETGGGVVYDGAPLAGVELRLVQHEIQVRGPMLLRCYRDGLDPRDADGWLATGDVGAFDDQGRLVVHGRRSDLIVTGGENVWPDPVERLLLAHPAIADVGVAGAPDPEWGEIVVAHVVPRAGHGPPALQELRDLVKAELPAYAAPRALRRVDALPRTRLGKLRRSAMGSASQMVRFDERMA